MNKCFGSHAESHLRADIFPRPTVVITYLPHLLFVYHTERDYCTGTLTQNFEQIQLGYEDSNTAPTPDRYSRYTKTMHCNFCILTIFVEYKLKTSQRH